MKQLAFLLLLFSVTVPTLRAQESPRVVSYDLNVQIYDDRIEVDREKPRHIRPIWEIDCADREAHTALYEKGSALLTDLMVRVGEESFFDFMAAVIRNRIAYTQTFFDLAVTYLGAENRDWIEMRLKE